MKFRSTMWLLLLALAVVTLASTGSQCSQATQPTVGRTAQSETVPDACKAQCWADYLRARLEEGKRYRLALQACSRDQTCIDGEIQIHLANLAGLQADRDDCLLACQHQQGSGTGGQ